MRSPKTEKEKFFLEEITAGGPADRIPKQVIVFVTDIDNVPICILNTSNENNLSFLRCLPSQGTNWKMTQMRWFGFLMVSSSL